MCDVFATYDAAEALTFKYCVAVCCSVLQNVSATTCNVAETHIIVCNMTRSYV